MKSFRTATVVAILWLFSPDLGVAASQGLAAKAIEVLQGEIVELKISAVGLTAVEGSLGQQTIHFYAAEGKLYAALVGVDLEAKPGVVNVVVKATTRTGSYRRTQIPLKIKAQSFQEENFSVPVEFDHLSSEVVQRIRQEQEQFDQIFATSTRRRLWEPPFILPASVGISSPFGYRRVINGTRRAPHTGVDLKAPLGTEVLAANHGRVALCGDFFFSGKSVVLDHGGGLYTMYFHLSQLNVEKGAAVDRGNVIGLSGMTGRVTGPHLHWAARLNGARVDPLELIGKLGDKAKTTAGSEATIEIKEE